MQRICFALLTNCRHIDPDGQAQGFSNDNLNRLTQERWYTTAPAHFDDGGWNRKIDYHYDGQGRLMNASTTIGANLPTTDCVYTYDALGRVLTYVDSNGVTQTNSYDANSNRTMLQVQLPGSSANDSVTFYGYDQFNHLTGELQQAGGSNQGVSFSYNLQGQTLTSLRHSSGVGSLLANNTANVSFSGNLPNGYRINRYDGAGRLTSISNNSAISGTIYGYSYDPKGQVTQMTLNATATGTSAVTRNYTYDNRDELTQGTSSYSYDPNFNRTSSSSQIGAGNRLKQDNSWAYRYDKNGNLITKSKPGKSIEFNITTKTYDPAGTSGGGGGSVGDSTINYEYDIRNRLTEVITRTVEGDGSVGTSQDVVYRYDAEDNRIQKQVNGVVKENYVNDPVSGNLLVVLDGSGNVIERDLYGDQADQVLAVQKVTPATTTNYWTMGDSEGTIRQVLDNNGSVVKAVDFDEFGNLITGSDTKPSLLIRQGQDGMIQEAETGLYYDRVRYLDPTTGRFISVDPAEDGSNWYDFTGNNPVNYTDPTGMEAFQAGSRYFSGINNLSTGGLNSILNGDQPSLFRFQGVDSYNTATANLLSGFGLKTSAQLTSEYQAAHPGTEHLYEDYDSFTRWVSGKSDTFLPTPDDVLKAQVETARSYNVGLISDPKIAVQAGGVSQAAFGLAGAIVTAPAVLTGVGSTAFLSSVDNFWAGWKTARTGDQQQTYLAAGVSSGLQMAGADKDGANIAGELTNLTFSVGSNYAAMLDLPQLTALSQTRAVAIQDFVGDLSNYRLIVDSSTVGTLGGNLRIARVTAEAPSAYSVAFETQLAPEEFGLSQEQHFQIANNALNAERATNPALAQLVPAPTRWGRPPVDWTWQHATVAQGSGRAGVLQLVQRTQHTPGSPYWPLFHPLPGGAGGYAEWAIPAGARPR